MKAKNMKANWNYPTSVRVGRGRIAELAAACAEFAMEAPLLVTDPGLAQLPMTANIVAACENAGLGIKIFCAIKPNPTADNVAAGVAAYRRGRHDGVIAFGGGSGLDVGKTVAVMATQDCALLDLEDIGDNWRRAVAARIAPIIAVPTTAGTGSEVGRAALIVHSDEQTDEHIAKPLISQRKVIIFHPNMLPSCVILDPELTVGLPPALTAATGMDALSHNLEAYCSPAFHPMAEGIAVEGMRLIKNHLPTAVAHGADIEARSAMLVASTMGATAFQRGLGAMHALAHPLGAVYDAHHGMLNAILMPYVLVANRVAIESRIARLARNLELVGGGHNNGHDDGHGGFDVFLQWVLDLRKQIGIPNDLSQIGIDDARVDEIGQMATADPSAGSNPIIFDAAEYSELVRRAINGDHQK